MIGEDTGDSLSDSMSGPRSEFISARALDAQHDASPGVAGLLAPLRCRASPGRRNGMFPTPSRTAIATTVTLRRAPFGDLSVPPVPNSMLRTVSPQSLPLSVPLQWFRYHRVHKVSPVVFQDYDGTMTATKCHWVPSETADMTSRNSAFRAIAFHIPFPIEQP